MRAIAFTAFLLTTVGFSGAARAHVTLAMPRISLAMAFDWNRVAATRVAGRPTSRAFAVTVAPKPREHVAAAYSRVEGMVRDAIPHYVPRDPDRRLLLRRVDVTPLSPCFNAYGGTYGLAFTVETTLLP